MYIDVKEYLDRLVTETKSVNKEDLDLLYDLLEYKPMREKERVKFNEIYDIIKSIRTEHERTKSLCLYRTKRIINHYVRDQTDTLTRRQVSSTVDVLKAILDYKRIYVTSMKYEDYIILEEAFKDIDTNILIELEKEIEEDTDNIDLDKYKDILDIVSKLDIKVFDYKSLNNKNNNKSEREPAPGDTPGALGGGGCYHFLVFFIKTLVKSRTYHSVLFGLKPTTCIYRLAKLITHIHLSFDKRVVVPRYFLEDNGYEPLTSLTLFKKKENKFYNSLYVLEGIGLAKVSQYNQEKSKAREVTLTQLGKSVGAVLGLFSRRVTIKQAELRHGDLTAQNRDYTSYIAEGILPDTSIIDPFLKSLETSTVNLTKYMDKFSEDYPIVTYELEDYIDHVIKNMYLIDNELDKDVRILSNYSLDIRNLTTGLSSKKKYRRVLQGKQLLVSFENIWTLSYTGRLFQRYGLQGISRESKTIVHDDCYNYDIPSSQLRVLKQLLEEIHDKYSHLFTDEDREYYSNIDWLDRYIDEEGFKELLIKVVGLEPSDWKISIYAIVFGASLYNIYDDSVINTIVARNRLNDNFDIVEYYKQLTPLASIMKLWMKYINNYRDDYELSPLAKAKLVAIENNHKVDPIKYSDFIYNGVVFVKKDNSIIKSKRKLSAFLLQGLEASFILNLALLIRRDSVSYEFDGVVSDIPLDIELIEEARRKSGFRLGDVIVKEFL